MWTDNPLLKVLFAEKTIQLIQKHIIEALEEKFDHVPDDLAASIRAIQDENELDSHFRFAVSCTSLDAFRNRLGLAH